MGLGSQPVKLSSERLKWDENRVFFFTHMLLDQQRKGKKDNNRWKPESWEFMVEEFEKRFQQSVTNKQLKAYVQVMKHEYGVIREMKNHARFGWNSAKKMLETTDYVWNDYLKTHREAKKWRDVAIPHYQEWFELFDGTIANDKRQPSSLSNTTEASNQSNGFEKTPLQTKQLGLDKRDHSTASSPPLPSMNIDLPNKRSGNEVPISSKNKKPRATVRNVFETTEPKGVNEKCKIMREAVPASLCMIKEATRILMSMPDLSSPEKAKMSNRIREGDAFVCFLEMDAETRKEWVKLELQK